MALARSTIKDGVHNDVASKFNGAGYNRFQLAEPSTLLKPPAPSYSNYYRILIDK